ncbi:MAG: hypothetical protein F4X54_07440 [Chloroflexi bacterium]|nr:hypothetical protein [Chloroflexota bacterium]MYB84551.1 hypothetical protein [Chloroflexota bacterium]
MTTSSDQVHPAETLEELEDLRERVALLSIEERTDWMLHRTVRWSRTLQEVEAVVTDAWRHRVIARASDYHYNRDYHGSYDRDVRRAYDERYRGYYCIEGTKGLRTCREPWLILTELVKLARGAARERGER